MRIICIPVGDLQTNCYLIYDESNKGVVVDPGGEATHLLDAIEKNDLHIEHVLLTHVHFDHILAAAEVIKATGADLLVPRGDKDALTDPALSLMTLARVGHISLKADRFLDDGDQISAGNLTFHVLHTPGHTPGSSCFLCGDIMLSGDTLFADSIGRTDFPGGDFSAMKQSLKRLSELEGEYTVLPGHGPETLLTIEKRQNPYMQSGYDSD